MGVRESSVEKYFKEKLEECGGISYKWISPNRIGVPDQIAIIKGQVHLVEIKTENGKLSDAQLREQKRLRDSGAIVKTLFGHKEVDRFISDLVV
jgi:hypothetical protein